MEVEKTRRSFLKSAVAAASTTAVIFPITKSTYGLNASFSGTSKWSSITPTPKYCHIDKTGMTELPTELKIKLPSIDLVWNWRGLV